MTESNYFYSLIMLYGIFIQLLLVLAVVAAGEETELLVGMHNEGQASIRYLICNDLEYYLL